MDRHLADQLVLFCALAHGTSRVVVPQVTAHVESHLRLVERFGARVALDGGRIAIEGIGRTATAAAS